ncbi:GNAT family N-acetyltransferase [Chryseobacterium sp.]|uniref:GNAT family N-acetyltransferase n=1 Tax=Chryseobacterium sp. TaxID=1871047 RepID=UPI0025BA934B|nr:GNAT family N-acetyltransferase [Chryseobacterium sp.]
MIHLKTYNKQELQEFISSGDFRQYDFLPITEHRAVSHIQNPKADSDQILLVLAFDDDQLAGYIGCMPDYFDIDGTIFRYAWLSTLFISDQFRGKRIAQTLLHKVFEVYKGQIAVTEFTPEAEGLYNKTGVFRYLEPKIGKRYYFRTDFTQILPTKKPKTEPLKPVLRITDSLLNSALEVKNCFISKPSFKFEILDKVDSNSIDFISQFRTYRTKKEINWAIENPWILEGKKDSNYLFSSFSEAFTYFWIKIYDEKNRLSSCALLLVRDGHLKIPYLFAKSDLEPFINLLSYFIVQHKIITLSSYQTELNEKITASKIFPKIHERNLERRYIFHHQLSEHLPQNFKPDYQDGDGDCMMT